MNLHRNAALSWSGRRVLAARVVDQGWTLSAAAEAAGVSVRCARKWVGRYRLEGETGLADRSSAPRRVHNRTAPDRVAAIVALRQLRMTAAEIAETLSMPLSTVSAVLSRSGLGRLGRIGLAPVAKRADDRSQPSGTSARGRASLSISISRSSAGSSAAPANDGVMASRSTTPAPSPTPPATSTEGPAGSTSTSRSTTTAASPTPRCSPTRKPPPLLASSAEPSPTTSGTASRSSGS